MLDTYKMRTMELPDEMRVLLNSYPRDAWDAHPGFRDKTQQWLRAHQAFRALSTLVRQDTEAVLNKDIGLDDYAERLAYFGGRLVGSLHGHHTWEDRRYFPELSAADPRFDAGLEVLEQDHADLDAVLDDMTRKANRVIKLVTLDASQAYDEAAAVLPAAEAIETLLTRHLQDEEDLAVPIILHHRLRG